MKELLETKLIDLTVGNAIEAIFLCVGIFMLFILFVIALYISARWLIYGATKYDMDFKRYINKVKNWEGWNV